MFRCPKCGETITPTEAKAEGDWADIIRLLPSFGSHGKLAFEYVELFGVNPIRMKGAKVFRRLQELSKLFREGRFTYRRKEYSISQAGVVEALKETCNRNFDEPLTNDNYLKKIMIGIAASERKETRDTLDTKQKERETRKAPVKRQLGDEDTGNEEYLPPEEVRRRAGEMVNRIGKKA